MTVSVLAARTLSATHLDFLASQAISESTIAPTGAYTAETRDDLPESLRFRTDLPGIVFQHHCPDGRVVAQYRPDKPGESMPKYGQEPGTGSIISLHPVMRARLNALVDIDGDGNHVGVKRFHAVMVEGTKQYLSYVENAPEGLALDDKAEPLPVIAFGVQGCSNWSSEGVVIPDLDGVLEGAVSLTVLFDADRETKYAVWQSGSRLKDYAETAYPGISVLFGKVPAGGSAGLDDVLGKRAAGEPRRRLVRGIHAKASENMGRCPAKPRDSKGRKAPVPRVDWTNGVIYEPDVIHESGGIEVVTQSEEVVAEFAARIVRTVQVKDDLKKGDVDLEHDLEVRIEGDPLIYEVLSVPDSMLRDVPYWRNQAGLGQASRKFYDNSDFGARAIEKAVRKFDEDDAVFVQAYKRMGWVECPDGVWRYITPSGAIGPGGVFDRVTARLDNSVYADNIRIPDPSEHSDEEHRAAVREWIEIGTKRLHNPLVWYAVVGGMHYASTGSAPRAGLIVVGKHGSGKTVVTQTAASAYGPNFHAEGGVLMGSMNGTANAVGDAGSGLHHMLVIVDDVRRRQSPRRQDEQDAGVESLIRKSYDGGSAGRARQRVDRTRGGRIVTDQPDASCPMVGFTAEYTPSAEAVGSSVERLLSITVTKKDTMKRGETENLKAIGRSGRPAIAWSGWLRWQSRKINAAGGLTAWVSQVEKRRVDVANALAAKAPDMSERARKVAAPPIVGWDLLMEYAIDIGAITEEDADALTLDAMKRIQQAAERHTRVEMSDDLTGPERMMARVRSLISAGDVRFEDDVAPEMLHKPVIGKWRETDLTSPETGEKEAVATLALNPDAIAKALGGGITGTQVIDALKDLAEVRESTGRYGWKVTISKAVILNALIVRKTVWEGGDD